MKIVFATNNPYKLKEVKRLLLSSNYQIVSLKDIGFFDDIPEPHDTLEANALEKARTIHQKFGINCFSEDTGLEVTALNNAPGVYSARYAGEQKSSENNMDLLLKNLEKHEDRTAQFRTVVALILDKKEYLFEGIVKGNILFERQGTDGFGYDAIFQAIGYQQSFAEITADEKNAISHRGKAIEKLIHFLQTQQL
ncbi:MAG: RdgB/HAM1 family non-canonical purine NTP pyrophosphatase [Chitinophagales bacterium]